MPRACSICTHNDRAAIDTALVAGDSKRTIADRFGLSETAVQRHKTQHLPLVIDAAKARADRKSGSAKRTDETDRESGAVTAVAGEIVKQRRHGDDLVEQMRALTDRTLDLLARAEASDDLKANAMAVREARANVETTAKLTGRWTEKREVTGKDGGPMEMEAMVVVYVPDNGRG